MTIPVNYIAKSKIDEPTSMIAAQVYISVGDRPGLGVDIHPMLKEQPELGRLFLKNLREVLDGFEGELPPPLIVVDAEPRYPEDAEVNGQEEDNDNPKMPLLKCTNDKTRLKEWNWHLEIDQRTGKIKDWPEGTTAQVWYKVCDCCKIAIDGMKPYDGYVPDFLSIDDEGFGDYMHLTIGPDGTIKNWPGEKVIWDWQKRIRRMEGEE